MNKDANKEPRHLDNDPRAEHEFDVITLVLAGVLAAIVLAAVGYGVFRSSEVAVTIPFPPNSSELAGKARTPAVTEGSGAIQHRQPGTP
jgi:hypothetical protein